MMPQHCPQFLHDRFARRHRLPAHRHHRAHQLRHDVSHRIDWGGNMTFGVGLVSVLTAITYGIQPYCTRVMAWTSPLVLTLIALGLASLVAFVMLERRIARPMVDFRLFRIAPFAYGNLANLSSSIARGGLQFMLMQGIWLPLHGYSFAETPLWSAIFMLPLTVGLLLAGPVAGYFSDRIGGVPFAVGGMVAGALSFVLLVLLAANFSYTTFAALLFANGLGSGVFVAPNSTQIMNSVPVHERGQASGMRATATNAGQVLSIDLFFSLMLAGLAATLLQSMEAGLLAQHVPPAIAREVAGTPAVASLFAAFLGYNPMGELIPSEVLRTLPPDAVATLTGKSFFPGLMSGPFKHGLVFAFTFSAVLYLLAALAPWRGGSRVACKTDMAKEAVVDVITRDPIRLHAEPGT
jgi:hypothetical protein